MSVDVLQRRASAAVAAALMLTLVMVANASPSRAADPVTSSAKTVTTKGYDPDAANAPFPDLEVTVSQTQDLSAQGITVSYKGGPPGSTPRGSDNGGQDFLQIMQCWGDDPDHPGRPDRRTCQFGTGFYANTRDGQQQQPLETVPAEDLKYSVDIPYSNPWTETPFVAWGPERIVDETKADPKKVLFNLTKGSDGKMTFKPDAERLEYRQNEFFTPNSSNEVGWAPFGRNGTGSIPFEVQTVMQSQGLGCGTPIRDAQGKVTGAHPCWLVAVPRPVADNGDPSMIRTPPLWWGAWEHHLAVKLDFRPLGTRCEMGKAEQLLAGGELALLAVNSWQPVLCQAPGASPYTITTMAESDALQSAAGEFPSALGLTSRALEMTGPDDYDPLAYAPILLGGVAVSYQVDSRPGPRGGKAPPAEYENRRNSALPPPTRAPRRPWPRVKRPLSRPRNRPTSRARPRAGCPRRRHPAGTRSVRPRPRRRRPGPARGRPRPRRRSPPRPRGPPAATRSPTSAWTRPGWRTCRRGRGCRSGRWRRTPWPW